MRVEIAKSVRPDIVRGGCSLSVPSLRRRACSSLGRDSRAKTTAGNNGGHDVFGLETDLTPGPSPQPLLSFDFFGGGAHRVNVYDRDNALVLPAEV